jgi:Cys-tRNA(Pro)/Cys-tRNA(Cys) deacylase
LQGGAAVTPAVLAARRAGVACRVLEYRHDPAAQSFGLEAAEALGVNPLQVYKTLVASLATARSPVAILVVAVIPVVARLDLKALAAATGAKRAAMAERDAAERATGYVIGGISPLGQRRRLATVLDESALTHAEIYVSAGRRGLEIALAPRDLVTLTKATLASISR